MVERETQQERLGTADIHNIEPNLMDLYRQKYELKDKLANVDKHINSYQSDKINVLRQVEGLKKYIGMSKEYKISYNPPREYYSWTVKADPQAIRDVCNNFVIAEYGEAKIPKFVSVFNGIINLLLDKKIGYEKYEVRRHKNPIQNLQENALEVSIETEQSK